MEGGAGHYSTAAAIATVAAQAATAPVQAATASVAVAAGKISASGAETAQATKQQTQIQSIQQGNILDKLDDINRGLARRDKELPRDDCVRNRASPVGCQKATLLSRHATFFVLSYLQRKDGIP